MELSIDPAVAPIGTQLVSAAGRGLSAGAAALPAVTALAPAGGDMVSMEAATAFAAEGAAMLAAIGVAQEEIARAGAAVTNIARIYTEVDTAAAGMLTAVDGEISSTEFVGPTGVGHALHANEGTGLQASQGVGGTQSPSLGSPMPTAQTVPGPAGGPMTSSMSPGVAASSPGVAASPGLAGSPGIAASTPSTGLSGVSNAASTVRPPSTGPVGSGSPGAPAGGTPRVSHGASAGGAPASSGSPGASAGSGTGRGLAPPLNSVNLGAPASGAAPVSSLAPAAPVGGATAVSPAASVGGVTAPGVASPPGRHHEQSQLKPKTAEHVSATNHLSGRRHRWSVLDLFNLHGKRALVTGASGGIGQIVALAYLQAGAQVAIAAHDGRLVEKVAGQIAADGDGAVLPITCDLAQPDQVTSMLGQVTAELGGVDIVVCNAGTGSVNGMLNMPVEEFQRIQNTNVTGVFLTAQAAARAMVAQGRGGVIINTASISGHIVNVPQQVGHYCAAKAAVIHLTKAMAVEFAPHKIRVNSVSPGYILSEPTESPEDYLQQWKSKIPLGRVGKPEELAGLYVYLASAASSYMTGSDVVIDGGYTCL